MNHSRHCAIPNARFRTDVDPACTCGQAARAERFLLVAARRTRQTSKGSVRRAAARLVADGWEQASRRYCMVSRSVGADGRGLDCLTLHPAIFAAFRELHPEIQAWRKVRERLGLV